MKTALLSGVGAMALASDAALAQPSDEDNEAAMVASVKQSFLSIGRQLMAKELEPLRAWANKTMSQDAHIAIQAIDRVGTVVLTHCMNAMHPYGLDQAVQIAAAAAAAEAQAVETANATHAESVALETGNATPVASESSPPASAPISEPSLASLSSTPEPAAPVQSEPELPLSAGVSTSVPPTGTPTESAPQYLPGSDPVAIGGAGGSANPQPAVQDSSSPPSDASSLA